MKKTSPTKQTQQGPKKTTKHSYSTSLPEQRSRLLAALKIAPISTIRARRDLDILMPAARVHELRHGNGYNIATHWETQETTKGNKHRVASYVLLPGKYQQGATR